MSPDRSTLPLPPSRRGSHSAAAMQECQPRSDDRQPGSRDSDDFPSHQLDRRNRRQQHLDEFVGFLFDGIRQQHLRDREDRYPQQIDERDRCPLAQRIGALGFRFDAAVVETHRRELHRRLNPVGHGRSNVLFTNAAVAHHIGDERRVPVANVLIRQFARDVGRAGCSRPRGRRESRSSRAADRSPAADSAPVLSIPGVAT